ncbi:hypothetical protein ACKAV7_010835 [Fusarium commune]
MLDFRPEQDPLVLIENRLEYFFSLAIYALQQGDYSPLLFIPSLDEDTDPRAPWLRGYSTGTWKLWDMGRCHRKATSQPIIRDRKIKPQLQTVGVIESFEYYDFGGDAESVMDYVVSKVVRASGRDAQALCEAMDRIFPRNEEKAVNGMERRKTWRCACFGVEVRSGQDTGTSREIWAVARRGARARGNSAEVRDCEEDDQSLEA